MAGTPTLNERLQLASKILSTSLGKTFQESQEAFKYLELGTLIQLYTNEIERKGLKNFLNEIPASLSAMRSTYLPFNLLNELSINLESSISEIISDSTSQKESFENTFMRMMGLPSSKFISQNNNITIIDHNGNKKSVDYSIVESEILNERQLPQNDRYVQINNNIFNLKNASKIVEDTESTVENIDDFVPINLLNIDEEFYAYTYLLIPPVQDERISYCVNEPNKIIPPNFSNQQSFQINGKNIRPSFLESVIRIRFDRLSGYSDFSTIENEGDDLIVDGESFGILESLFILRIQAALKAFSSKLGKDIDELRQVQEQTNLAPIKSKDTEKEEPRTATDTSIIDENEDEYTDFEKQQIIEDSIMALLDDNSKALDLQTDTQRKTSIKNSHIISNLIGIIDLPRQRIQEEFKKIKNGKSNTTDGPGGEVVGQINTLLGTSQGVGVIHILVFSLALFTIPEDYLLGLLSDLEYEKFLKEFQTSGTGFLSTQTSPALSRVDPILAINLLTDYILEGYGIFHEELVGGIGYFEMPSIESLRDYSSSNFA